LHLSRYIHLNPVELIKPDWKEKGVKDWREIKKFLERYRYSSYLDYMGVKNLPSIINQKPLLEYFKRPENYQSFVEEYLAENIPLIASLLFE